MSIGKLYKVNILIADNISGKDNYMNNSKEMRCNPLFMRNSYQADGRWKIPLIRKQKIDVNDIRLIACSDTKANDNEANKKNGVHFLLMITVLTEYMIIPNGL